MSERKFLSRMHVDMRWPLSELISRHHGGRILCRLKSRDEDSVCNATRLAEPGSTCQSADCKCLFGSGAVVLVEDFQCQNSVAIAQMVAMAYTAPAQ